MRRALRLCLTIAALLPATAAGAEPTRIYIDFGFAWNLHEAGLWGLGTNNCDGLRLRACGGQTDYLDQAGLTWGNLFLLPPSIMPLWYELERNSMDDPAFEGIDYDGAAGANGWDALAVAADVAAYVEEFYAPFDVEVRVVESETLEDAAAWLASTPTNDAYIFVGGTAGFSGIASFDWGNERDDIGFAFAGNFIGMELNGDEYSVSVEGMARTIAHEAGHTFGLTHTGDNNGGPSRGDYMSHFSTAGARVMRYPMEWADEILANPPGADFREGHEADEGLPFAQTRQNAFQVLKDVLGLRPGAPAYVTGTGLHDSIRVSSWWGSWAYVRVRAYDDPQRTQLADTYSYFILTGNGVYIEAGPGDDSVSVNGTFAAEIHGGPGNDVLSGGSGPDVLVGDRGDDVLQPGAGDDTIRYDARTARVHHGGEPHASALLGTDRLRDGGGVDTLDFDAFPERVVIDLGDADEQVIDRPSLIGSFQPACLQPCTLPPTPEPRLRVQLEWTDGAPGFENVVGSDRGDDITGSPAANHLAGGAGNDTLEGAGGNDVFVGGAGSDTCTNNGSFILCDGKRVTATRLSSGR